MASGNEQALEEAKGEAERGIWQQNRAKSHFQYSNNIESAWKKEMTRSWLAIALDNFISLFSQTRRLCWASLRPRDINMNFSSHITGILAHNFSELGKKTCEISQILIFRITVGKTESCLCMDSTPWSCILSLCALKTFSFWKEKFKKLQHYRPFPSSTKSEIANGTCHVGLFLCKTLRLQVCCQERWGSGEAARCNREMLSTSLADFEEG